MHLWCFCVSVHPNALVVLICRSYCVEFGTGCISLLGAICTSGCGFSHYIMIREDETTQVLGLSLWRLGLCPGVFPLMNGLILSLNSILFEYRI